MKTWIKRVRISGGYLDGLDISFSEGLNVIIGARGTGKSTLLRLIQFGLGVSSATSKDSTERDFLKSVLNDGEVTLDIEGPNGLEIITVNAKGEGQLPHLRTAALALGQNEIEAIANSAQDRRNLIDLRSNLKSMASIDTRPIASITGNLYDKRISILENLYEDASRIQIEKDLEEKLARQSDLVSQSDGTMSTIQQELANEDDEINAISSEITASKMQRDELADILLKAASFESDLRTFSTSTRNYEYLESMNKNIASTITKSEAIKKSIDETLKLLVAHEERLRIKQSSLMATAAPKRAQLDSFSKGLGELTSAIRSLRAQLEKLDADKATSKKTLRAIQDLKMQRNELIDQRDNWLLSKYEERISVTEDIREIAGRDLSIEVLHLEDTESYQELLQEGLTGSGLQFRSIASNIAHKVLPNELVELLEDTDVNGIAELLLISPDRAAKILAALDKREILQKLSTVELEDSVDFYLKSSGATRRIQELSMGQKCAITLPILISDQARTLLIDQPEDHLDNLYLVKTVITAIRKRTLSGNQSILATHNPNIPVIGIADQVIHLESNGRSGFVKTVGHVDAPSIKKTITRTLEGGAEAFDARVAFYATTENSVQQGLDETSDFDLEVRMADEATESE